MKAANSNLPIVVEHGPDERASNWQIAATAIAAVFILGIFFYGISSQRNETGAATQQMAATNATPSAQPTPQQGESGRSTQPPNSQQQTNQQSGSQKQQPATQATVNKSQESAQQQNKAQQTINRNAAQAPGGSATTGQGSGSQNGSANGQNASQPATPAK